MWGSQLAAKTQFHVSYSFQFPVHVCEGGGGHVPWPRLHPSVDENKTLAINLVVVVVGMPQNSMN